MGTSTSPPIPVPEGNQDSIDCQLARNEYGVLLLANDSVLPLHFPDNGCPDLRDRDGGEVLVPNPGYFYTEPAELAGLDPVPYSLDEDCGLDVPRA